MAHLIAWPRRQLGSRLYYGALGSIGLGSILFMGKLLCNQLDRSSSIARQTLLNIRADPECANFFGNGKLSIEGSLKGDLNQIAGHANLRFRVVNASAETAGDVYIEAKRHYLNWTTQRLIVDCGLGGIIEVV